MSLSLIRGWPPWRTLPLPWSHSLRRCAVAAVSQQAVSIEDATAQMVSRIGRLEQLASQRTDPEKLRWRKLIKELLSSREGFVGANLVRAVVALLHNPVALASPSVGPLIHRAVISLNMSTNGLSAREIAQVMLVVSQTNLYMYADEGVPKNAIEQGGSVDDFSDVLEVIKPKKRPGGKIIKLGRQIETRIDPIEAVKAAKSVFWGHLVPRLLDPQRDPKVQAEFAAEPLEVQAQLLLAMAFAWRCIPGDETAATILPSLSNIAASALEKAAPMWRSLESDKEVLSVLIAALGLMEAQNAGLLRRDDGTPSLARGIARSLETRLLASAGLPSLLKFSMGIQGLARADMGPRIGEEVSELLGTGIQNVANSRRSLSDFCEALLFVRACGRLAPREPWVTAILQHAANGVDRLQRGERIALRAVLAELAYACEMNQSEFVTNSPEAIVNFYANQDWFARKSRAQTSWFRQRGAI